MKLESLKEFKIEKNKSVFVFGGNDNKGKWVTTSKPQFTDKNGCVVTTTDSYYDKNGNGVHDNGESATACISVSCE